MKSTLTLLLAFIMSASALASDYRLVGAYLSRDNKIVVTLQSGSKIKRVAQSKVGIRNDTLGCNIDTCTASKFKQVAGDLFANVLLKDSNETLEEVFIGNFVEGSLLYLDNISVTEDLRIQFDVK